MKSWRWTHTFLLSGEGNYIISVFIVHCFFFQVFKEPFLVKGSCWGFCRLVLLTETRREKSILMKEETHYNSVIIWHMIRKSLWSKMCLLHWCSNRYMKCTYNSLKLTFFSNAFVYYKTHTITFKVFPVGTSCLLLCAGICYTPLRWNLIKEQTHYCRLDSKSQREKTENCLFD